MGRSYEVARIDKTLPTSCTITGRSYWYLQCCCATLSHKLHCYIISHEPCKTDSRVSPRKQKLKRLHAEKIHTTCPLRASTIDLLNEYLGTHIALEELYPPPFPPPSPPPLHSLTFFSTRLPEALPPRTAALLRPSPFVGVGGADWLPAGSTAIPKSTAALTNSRKLVGIYGHVLPMASSCITFTSVSDTGSGCGSAAMRNVKFGERRGCGGRSTSCGKSGERSVETQK